jgi:pimeloyl-ACP methyl ester carboxylesterase
VHQPEVARLALFVSALVVAAPVVCAGRTALRAGAFLVEFVTQGRPPVLSALTGAPLDRRDALGRSATPGRPGALGEGGADLYVHTGLDAGRPLVLAHGLAPEGKDDPRVRAAAALLARAGFDVAVPTIPGLTRGRLDPEDVEPVIAALAARPGRAALVGVSVGAGPALLAAADPRVRDQVSAVLSLGGYASALEVLRFWLTGVYAYEGVHGRVDHDPELVRTFLRANADRLDPAWRAALDADPREAAGRLLESPPPDLRRYLKALSPIRVAPSIGAGLFLVHGRADRAVPYTESLRLAAARPARTTLVLVGLVEHVEGARGRGAAEVRDLFALWRVIYAVLCA